MKIDILKKILLHKKDNLSFVLIRDIENEKDIFYSPKNRNNTDYDLSNEIIIKAEEALIKDKSALIDINNRKIFLHVYNTHLKLIIIGAVHISLSLSKIALILGYQVTIIDPRESFINSQDFSKFPLDK